MHPGGSTGGRLRVSGVADKFHRVSNASRSTHSAPADSTSPETERVVVTTTMEGFTGPASAGLPVAPSSNNSASSGIISIRNFQSPPNSGNAPHIQNIDRATGWLPNITTSGFHVPPEVLGQPEDPSSNNNSATMQDSSGTTKRGGTMADLNKNSRRRSIRAVKAAKSPAAAAAAVKGVSSVKAETKNLALDSSMFTSLSYQGMEVVFASTGHHCVAGFCSRTNFLFQKLNLTSNTPIVSITSNSSSGMIVVAHQDGIIQTYIPLPTDPVDLNEVGNTNRAMKPKSVYGRFRWIDSLAINAAEVFYQPGESPHFRDRRQSRPGELIDISSSYNFKLLVAHQQQLAVFDVPPFDIDQDGQGTADWEVGSSAVTSLNGRATLLWTTMLPSKVVTAKMSGDGQALVAVLERPDDSGMYGARTFIHDSDDGSNPPSRPPRMERSTSIGMVFKPGPFLPHATPVTRISFRGMGHMTPSACPEETQGNDLLLTYCEGDSSVRVFNQNAWRQLMLWAAPPNSRADWIRGSSAFSLGDLETHKKSGNSRMIRPGSRRPSSNAAELAGGGGVNSGLRNARPAGTGSPTSAAGAWIAELTFRGAYPALRLSRLSYMKRGNDDSQPAHFESVAAILPAGSIVAGSTLNADDMGLTIHGFWPAWNPWLSPTAGNDSSGSAMQFLGLSSVPPPTNGMFGETYAGGTHSPPTELRMVAAHPKNGFVVMMDFPLWGDDDFGAMELGSPIRSVLALSEVASLRNERVPRKIISESMDYESSRLCAHVGPDARSISLLWRKAGSMSLYSPQWRTEDAFFSRSTADVAEPKTIDLLIDLSTVPVPLALPPLRLPKGTTSADEDTVVAIKWWPDDSFGGPPLLVAITKSTTLLVYEIPPPMFTLEPAMPNFDSFNGASSVASGTELYDTTAADSGSDDEESTTARQEYDVLVTPHPDFGLGLRLESPMDGLPAVAGSFKKNPLNDGMLPAEKTGMIQLGDELLSVNGVSLENMTFDDIIATVRNVGAEAGPGEPLKMRFRPVPADRSLKNSAVVHESFSVRSTEMPPSQNPEKVDASARGRSQSDSASLAALLLSSSVEAQLEFGRIIAVVRKAIAPIEGNDILDRLLVLPWGCRHVGSSAASRKLRAVALIIHAFGNTIQVKRLELPTRTGLEKARIVDFGNISIVPSVESSTNHSESIVITSVKCVGNASERKCFIVTDSLGGVTVLYLQFAKKKAEPGEGSSLEMTHEQYRALGCVIDFEGGRLHSDSATLFACVRETESPRRNIKVWHARPDASARLLQTVDSIKDRHFGADFYESEIVVEPSESDSVLLDFCFHSTGYLDTFPTIVAFLTTEAIVYQRRGGSKKWLPITRVLYPSILTSSMNNSLLDTHGTSMGDKPWDEYPHLLQSIQSSLSSYDEKNYMLSDWHPEALLSLLCTEDRGAKVALKGDIKRILLWLADKIDAPCDDNFSPSVPLLAAPFGSWGYEVVAESDTDEKETEVNASASAFFFSMSNGGGTVSKPNNEDEKKLRRLLGILDSRKCSAKDIDTSGKSRDYVVSWVSQFNVSEESDIIFPSCLTSLHANEVRVLKAIINLVVEPPKFDKLDPPSEFALSLYSLHFRLHDDESQEESGSSSLPRPSYASFHVRRPLSSASDSQPKLLPQNASAGCLAALLSDYQEALIDRIRNPGEKLDWTCVRDLRLAFWLRSDEKLRSVSEEVGQKMYKDSKDILKSAIFFIVAGKKRTLTNLAAADNTESGKKFYKFLTTFDFTTERGRSAAEKNAFSLLSKNRYDSAAAFFLLAEPPILRSAVETIATKMEDIDLAFLVARLMSNPVPGASQALAFGMGGGLNFGGMGGGGGFAGSGSSSSEVTKDKESFTEWTHQLGPAAVRLILDRGLPSAHSDSCFSAVQLLWLGRFDEATHFLTGLIDTTDGSLPSFSDDATVPQLQKLSKTAISSRDPTMTTMNSFINFASGPYLLKLMKASTRTRLAATLVVAQSLSKAGIEVAAFRSLVRHADDASFKEDLSSPLSFDLAPTPKATNESGGPPSSIFDMFDVAPQSKPKAAAPATGGITSSIFDSFDAPPPPKPKSVGLSQPSAGMSSSIFDAFEAPPPAKPKATGTVPYSEPMASSIFDSFDAPPPAKPKAVVPASGVMASSIFDSFDVAPAPRPSIAAVSASGEVASSIFDSFDPPHAKKAVTPSPSEGTSSEFNVDRGLRANAVHDDSVSVVAELRRPPSLWREWRDDFLVDIASRRLIRELATLCAPYHCDAFDHAGFEMQPLVTNGASQVLQFHCDGEDLLDDVRGLVQKVSKVCALDSDLLVQNAIRLLHSPYESYRSFYVVLLLLSAKHVELAEDVVRNSSQSLIGRCSSVAFSNGHVADGRHCMTYTSGLAMQKLAFQMSWQLELCLWIHRGGALPLSGLALNEAICAVRVGCLVASWNRDFEVQETMLRQPPDCLMDEGRGRQLWTSLKIISGGSSGEKVAGTGSGGWEFLVDCRRSEATQLLHERPTGCFIIRPHPQDHGVFTLSFKTNLVPTQDTEEAESSSADEAASDESQKQPPAPKKPSGSRPVKRDDVVQHAIIRLSDSGFRCGSFGPFGTLMKLLDAVSSSLPFDLRFDLPPTESIIKDEGSKPSPNSVFLRKLAIRQAEFANKAPTNELMADETGSKGVFVGTEQADDKVPSGHIYSKERAEMFGLFLELLLLSEVRKQLCSVAAAEYDNVEWTDDPNDDVDSVGSLSDVSADIGVEKEYATAARVLRPLLTWCRMMEVEIVSSLAPSSNKGPSSVLPLPISLKESETAIEVSASEKSTSLGGCDSVIRQIIQPGCGVEFRTLRLGDGSENAMVVLFSRKEAVAWFINNGAEDDENEALERLRIMERNRVIEPVDLRLLAPKAYKKTKKIEDDEHEHPDHVEGIDTSGIRYRLVDPWEVEPLESREAETRGATLGRKHLLAFSLGRVASSCQHVFRSLGGVHLLELWAVAKGSISLTKAIATVHPPWERSAGGDLLLNDGVNAEPSDYENSIREHLYRNALFRRLKLPQRFVALTQVELLDLKNLTSPGGSLALTVYSLLRLKRARSNAPLTSKARTLDSVATSPVKLAKSSGPNAPASWGSLVRFRFPLPEQTSIEGKSYDRDREALFKGPPSVLQVSVYEKKFMSDTFLGGADVNLDGLSSGGQLEEWVPLKTEDHGINWFARIRLTLRFELMCLAPETETIESLNELAPSVGLQRIQHLCSMGGAQMDLKKSVSTPDLLSYLESMVY